MAKWGSLICITMLVLLLNFATLALSNQPSSFRAFYFIQQWLPSYCKQKGTTCCYLGHCMAKVAPFKTAPVQVLMLLRLNLWKACYIEIGPHLHAHKLEGNFGFMNGTSMGHAQNQSSMKCHIFILLLTLTKRSMSYKLLPKPGSNLTTECTLFRRWLPPLVRPPEFRPQFYVTVMLKEMLKFGKLYIVLIKVGLKLSIALALLRDMGVLLVLSFLLIDIYFL